MGLFDRKREEPAPPPAPMPAQAPAPQQAAQAKVKVAAPKPAPPPQPPPPPKPEFGIQKAMELMRKLPIDNVQLVVQVVRATLESTNVDVAQIISDAREKRSRIAVRIEGLKEEIADFEEEISARRQEIAALEADEAETKTVQERLEMAMNGGPPGPGRAALEQAMLDDLPKPPF
ncbi:MAG: hypothetical protein AAGF11_49105 [Myxococcota bacterium]